MVGYVEKERTVSYSHTALMNRNDNGFVPVPSAQLAVLRTLANFGDPRNDVCMQKPPFVKLEALDGSSSGRVLWRVFWRAPSLVIDAALLRLRYSIAHPGNGRTPVSNAIDETERMDGPGGAGRPRTLHRQILLRARKLCRLPSLFRAQHQAGSVRPRGRTGTG